MSSDASGAAAEDAAGHGGGPEQLVKMANDIGHFFRAEPEREDAIAGIANHIDKFWTRRMREKLRVHLDRGGDTELDDLPREAVTRLFAQRTAAAPIATAATAASAASAASAPRISR
jgi:formate dehydrogenase subunit delta